MIAADDLPQQIHSRVLTLEDRGLVTHILEALPSTPTIRTQLPLIVLIHGFPELAYSWRHIMVPLADLGYHVVAPDQRGYGRTTAFQVTDSTKMPIQNVSYDDDLTPHTITSLATDIRSLIRALGEQEAECVIGHDFGSPVAGAFAQLYPEMLKSVICMSAPYTGIPSHLIDATKISPEATLISNVFNTLAQLNPPRKHYTAYYSGREANKDMLEGAGGLPQFLRQYFYVKSANWKHKKCGALSVALKDGPQAIAHAMSTLPDYYVMRAEETMPQTTHRLVGEDEAITNGIGESDMQFYATEYGRTGFQGGLNNYRANGHPNTGQFLSSLVPIDSKLDLSKFQVPAMYIAGEKDVGAFQTPGALDKMKSMMVEKAEKAPIGEVVFIKNAGHWVQQENSGDVAALIAKFLKMIERS